MTATWTNPETGVKLTVFVHNIDEMHGEAFARVNKGEVKTHYTFFVRVSDTNVILA